MSKRPSTAFVLSGGASLGAIQVGMLRALYERGIAPDLIVGTSAGALNGAFIASRPQTVETADALAAVWRGLSRGQVFPLNPLTGLLGFLGSRDHLVPDSGLRRLIARHVEHERLEELPMPLHVVAVDVITGEELRLSSGPDRRGGDGQRRDPGRAAARAVGGPRADGRRRGQQHADLPRRRARRGGDLRAAHRPRLRAGGPAAGALGMALHAISLLTHRRLIDDIEKHRDDAKLVVLPPPCPLAIPPIDFGHADTLIERGYQDAGEFLDSGGAERPPIHMRMHRHEPAGGKKRRATVAN